ncbi:MarR family winged helix-turn-helix transcriptional regulator [Streptomyces sp. NPDC048438]|uniref:MarR family winged helix-turn-helix transcriptional regulator n=1 Tax=Streptomyces sp. NPDC048438 TaxID=3365551 RepID=UPI00371E6815
MSERQPEQLPDDLVRLAWTLHRALRHRQTPPTGQPTRPLAQVEVLRVIDSRPGISVREIATALSMQPNNVSTLVTQLTRDGFIDRRPSAHDRRFVELHPTGKMIAAGDEVSATLNKAITEALQGLPTDAVQRISAALPDLWELARTLAPTP